MKKLLLSVILAVAIGEVSAQGTDIRDAFKEMPDSIMPYLSKNNRLDFIDFLDSGMKAEVKNSLGGTSEMLSLASDSLTIRMNESMRVDMLALDSVIVMIETFTVDSIYGESKVHYYTSQWQPITQPSLTEQQQQRINRLKLQNIVKRDDDLLKKH